MALSKIKQIKNLSTPPAYKKGVRTFVKEYNPKLIKEVILRELRRGGGVFYIYNSIAAIEDKKRELEKLIEKNKNSYFALKSLL